MKTQRANRSRTVSGELISGLILIGILVAMSILYTVGGVGDAYSTGETNLDPPSAAHLLGTDNLGRDMLSRLAVAAGTTIRISAVATVIAVILGAAFGLMAGYGGRMLDSVIMRAGDVLLAIPAILVALIVRVVFGAGTLPLILAMGIVYTPLFARVMRAPTLTLRQRDYVVAAELAGVPRPLIAIKHILPNAITPLLVQAAATASEIVLLEAALSYLGQGVQPPNPSAGRMISDFQKYLQTDPLLVLLPALLIVLISVGWNLIADGIQDQSQRHRVVDFPVRKRSIINLVPLRAQELAARRRADADAAAGTAASQAMLGREERS